MLAAALLLLSCRTEDIVATADSGLLAGAAASGGSPSVSTGGSSGEGGGLTASCTNAIRDPNESDVDCGGACPGCAVGAVCTSNDDCASGSCAENACAATLSVFYRTSSRLASALAVRPSFEIHNDGPSVVPLSELEIRYFFTNEGSSAPISQCPNLPPDCDVLQLSFGSVNPVRPLADSYLSVAFTAAAESVAPGGVSRRYEVSFHSSGIGPLQQSNDYSFDPNSDDAAPSQTTCLYRNGKLIWGLEPGP
ncbi:MAG TPA: cellulose binding domain-containing protein [Polyangiaceae bacterium]|nr:cellulose binding domain-containing protein [Polyangiaceae bacterium]